MRLLDQHSIVLHERRVDHAGRRLVSMTSRAEISATLQAAVIASEDRSFLTHGGVDGGALLEAGRQWLAGSLRRGASTISVQVVAPLRPELRPRGLPRTGAQKWRQMRLA